MFVVLLMLYHLELNTYLILCRQVLNLERTQVKLNLRPSNNNLKLNQKYLIKFITMIYFQQFKLIY